MVTNGSFQGATPVHRVVFDGQSLNNITLTAGKTYPFFTMAGLGIAWSNIAINGYSWTALANDVATRRDVYAGTADTLTLMMNGGTSDIALELNSGAQLMTDVIAYADSARAAGFDNVIASTVVHASNGAWTAGMETARQDYNALVLADAGGDFDGVIDFDVSPVDDSTDTTYFFDNIHWTTKGCEAAGEIGRAVLTTVLGI